MESSNNNLAVLDVVVENKASLIIQENAENLSNGQSKYSTNNNPKKPLSAGNDLSKDIVIKIDCPQKVLDTLETYITFQITSTIYEKQTLESEFIVRRRYNDFIWLRQKLVESHPFCIVPPLPGKHTLIGQLDRYSKEFIFIRMKALNVFLKRVVEHPILHYNEQLKTFLTAKQGTFSTYQKQQYKISPLTNSSLTPFQKLKDSEFDNTKTNCNLLSEKLTGFDRISQRIQKQNQERTKEVKSLQVLFSNWAEVDSELSHCLEHMSAGFNAEISALNDLSPGYTEMNCRVKDLTVDIGAVIDVLKRRDLCQIAYESAAEELAKCYSEKEKLSKITSEPSNTSNISFWKRPVAEKIDKLDVYIPQLLQKAETSQDTLECANACLRSDLFRWHDFKNTTIKNIFADYIKQQVEFHSKNLKAWQNVQMELEKGEN